MSNYSGPGQNFQYVLPFQNDAVPSSFKSNLAPRPINCVLQTTVVPSTSGNASVGGQSVIQVPLGNSAYMVNPYLRFRVTPTVGTAVAGARFKGAAQSANALISSVQTSINSTLIDNILNYDKLADCILSHSCSKEWLSSDGAILMASAGTTAANLGAASDGALAAVATYGETYCVPLLGMLSGQQSMPLWAINGTMQINVQWTQSIAASILWTAGAVGDITALTFSDVALVYDRVAVEGDFIAKMKSDMASSGAKYVYSYTNYQSLTQVSAAGIVTLNTGLNVSSLRGVVVAPILTTAIPLFTGPNFPQPSGTTNFQLTLDGRLVSSVQLNSVTAPATTFVELQKVFSRCFDSSVTDNSNRIEYRGTSADGLGETAKSFALGISTCRVAEGLQFQGSPVSVAGIQLTQGDALHTNFIFYISDYSLIIGADGMIDLVR